MAYAIIPVVLAVLGVALGRRLLTLLMILAYLTIEGFLKLLSNYNPVVHIGLDVIVLTVTAWAIAEAIVRRQTGLAALPWTRLIILHVVWVVLQLLNPNSPGLMPGLASFKIHLTMIPLYFLAAGLFSTPRDVRRFLVGLVVISLVPYVFALAQYALGPASVLDLSPRAWQNVSYYHEWRPFGTSAVPGGASVYAFLCAPAAVVLLLMPASRRVKLLAVAGLTLAAGAFIVSGVRQTLLGTALALVAMTGLLMSRGRGTAAVALSLVAVLSLGAWTAVQTWLRPMSTEAVGREARAPDIWRERDVTDRVRTLGVRRTYTEARVGVLGRITARATRFPFGAGLGRTGSTAGAFAQSLAGSPESARIQAEVGWSDNFFADMIAETGIPGAIILTTILLGMLAGALRLAWSAADPTIAVTAAAIAGFYISILAMSWGSQPLLANPITAFFWTFSGIIAAMRRMVEQPAEASAEEPDGGWDATAVPVQAIR